MLHSYHLNNWGKPQMVLLALKDPTVPTEVKTALVNAQTKALKKAAELKKLLETLNTLSKTLKNVADAAPMC